MMIRIADLQLHPKRQAYFKAGTIRGQMLELSEEEYFKISFRRGFGDWLHDLIAPLLKGTRFEHCKACEKRRQWLNRILR